MEPGCRAGSKSKPWPRSAQPRRTLYLRFVGDSYGRQAAGAPARPYARSEARNEAARAALTPYADGERPWPIVVSAIVATVFGGFNLVSLLIGAKLKVGGQKPGTAGVLLFALVICGAIGLFFGLFPALQASCPQMS